MLFRPVRYKPEDGKTGGGTGNEPGSQTQQKGDGANNGNPPTKTPQEAGVNFATKADFQKAVDDILKERLEREKKNSEEAAKKAADEALAEAAKKNGEWQKVAEQREKEIAEALKKLQEAEPVKEKADRYSQALGKHLETQRSGLPEAITKLLDKLDAVDQLEWLATNKESLVKIKLDGPPPTPTPDGAATTKQLEDAKKEFERKARSWY